MDGEELISPTPPPDKMFRIALLLVAAFGAAELAGLGVFYAGKWRAEYVAAHPKPIAPATTPAPAPPAVAAKTTPAAPPTPPPRRRCKDPPPCAHDRHHACSGAAGSDDTNLAKHCSPFHCRTAAEGSN